MNFFEIMLLSFGLAMDAVAVSIASGVVLKQPKLADALKIGLAFGLFQTLMPVAGWLAGVAFRDLVAGIDHWIAFILLLFIGLKMIVEAAKGGEEDNLLNPLDLHVLLMLSIATSIDALAAGIGFAFLRISIILTVSLIGLTTFILSTGAVYVGKRFGHILENKARILGGIVLIGIGVKILWEHLHG